MSVRLQGGIEEGPSGAERKSRGVRFPRLEDWLPRIGETIQDANIGYMDVTLNNGCTEALGASAVLDQVNSTITLAQAKSIATAQGYTVTKITPDFTGNWVDVGWVIDETLDYYVETSKECTALIINAVTSAVSVVSDCATPG